MPAPLSLSSTRRASEFYFLEMNTRLQVEHPITELVAGVDLVKWQLRIANGEHLALEQEDLTQRGHAIECRLYAEDPANNFLPATGPLLHFSQPQGPGVRVDAGYASGDEISVHYDPLVAKLTVWAEDRPAAIAKMLAALRATVLLGLTNNGRFLQDVLDDADFRAGVAYTTWVEEHFKGWQPPNCTVPAEILIAAALTQFRAGQTSSLPPAGPQSSGLTPGSDPYSPWLLGNSFRVAN